jgi:hypothetical protein
MLKQLNTRGHKNGRIRFCNKKPKIDFFKYGGALLKNKLLRYSTTYGITSKYTKIEKQEF